MWPRSCNDSLSQFPRSPQGTPGTMALHLYIKYDEKPERYFPKNWEGVCGTLPETLTLFQTKICDFPYPISDLIKNSDLKPWSQARDPERMTSCYGTYMVGINIKTELVLSPNDEEVPSSKKHTQSKTRVHKPCPISDQNG